MLIPDIHMTLRHLRYAHQSGLPQAASNVRVAPMRCVKTAEHCVGCGGKWKGTKIIILLNYFDKNKMTHLRVIPVLGKGMVPHAQRSTNCRLECFKKKINIFQYTNSQSFCGLMTAQLVAPLLSKKIFLVEVFSLDM
jgi:hypothetical protein